MNRLVSRNLPRVISSSSKRFILSNLKQNEKMNMISYRSLTTIHQPFTRNRKTQNDDNHEQFDNFPVHANECLQSFQRALQPMLPLNPSFKISSSPLEVRLDTGSRGHFILSIDHHMHRMSLVAPNSGMFQYTYDSDSQAWIGVEDRHDMRELITRELLRHFRGCPAF